jgi:hypothetical protein
MRNNKARHAEVIDGLAFLTGSIMLHLRKLPPKLVVAVPQLLICPEIGNVPQIRVLIRICPRTPLIGTRHNFRIADNTLRAIVDEPLSRCRLPSRSVAIRGDSCFWNRSGTPIEQRLLFAQERFVEKRPIEFCNQSEIV